MTQIKTTLAHFLSKPEISAAIKIFWDNGNLQFLMPKAEALNVDLDANYEISYKAKNE